MHFSYIKIVFAATCCLALAAPASASSAGSHIEQTEPASDQEVDAKIFARDNYCGCTDTRTCGCNGGYWCRCLTPAAGEGIFKARCAFFQACGCNAGKYGYCVVSFLTAASTLVTLLNMAFIVESLNPLPLSVTLYCRNEGTR